MECNKEKTQRDFPGVPVVKTLASNAGGVGSVPGWEAKIPHACGQKTRQNRSIVAINSIKTLKKKSLLLSQLVPLSPSHTVYTSLFSISASPFCSVTQLCLTLWDPMDCNLPGSSVLGISQARILEWVTISFSRGSSTPRHRTSVSCTGRQILHHWTTREALAST